MTNHTDDLGSESHEPGCGGRHGRRSRRRHSREESSEGRRRRSARKERVLHTRVSEQLSDDIRRFAEDLRVPASNLVRNVLEEVFTMVDSVSDDVGDLMDDLVEEAEGVRERVGRQARARRSGGGPRTRRRARRSGSSPVDDVEDELRRDEAAEARSAEAADAASPDAQEPAAESKTAPPAKSLFPNVLGWQPLVLNQDLTCGRCERELSAGESAFLGMTTSGLTDTALCGRCASTQ